MAVQVRPTHPSPAALQAPPAPPPLTPEQQRNAEAVQRLRRSIMELLRHEAYTQLSRAAENASPEEASPEGEHCRRWFGFDLVPETEVRALQQEQLLLELEEKRLRTERKVLSIRYADSAATLAEVRDPLDVRLEEIAARLQAIRDEQAAVLLRVEQSLERRRRALVQHEARRLFEEYQLLAERMPFNPFSDAVPEGLRRWVLRQRKLTTNPVSRLYLYLMLRETIFHGANCGAPLVDERPLHHLEEVGAPRNKREERDMYIIARQFVHPNGDRRVDRDTRLTELHAVRMAASRSGKPGNVPGLDVNGSDYDGTPTLPALTVVDMSLCQDCGAAVKDGIRNVAASEDEVPVWVYQRRCECSVEDLSPPFVNRRHLEEFLRGRERARRNQQYTER